MIRSALSVAGVLLVTSTVVAQTAPAPASAPAATQRARYEVNVPPGFQKLTAADHSVLVEPADIPWVQEALADFKPTTRPTTMPIDLVTSLKAARPQIEREMAADLGITDKQQTTELFDDILVHNLTRLGELKVPLFFLVTTRDKLKQLLIDGWRDPRLHYNKTSDDVQFVPTLELSLDRPLDDYVVPAMYGAQATPEQRKRELVSIIDRTEAGLAGAESSKAQAFVHTAIMNFIGRNIFLSLKVTPDQEWLSMGVSSTLAAKYVSTINHMDFKQLMQRMTADRPQNPISPRTINLAHPVDPKDLRPQAVPLYIDAMGRKAMTVVMKILDSGGPEAVKKIVEGMKKQPPKDGDALVQLIKEASGVDVSDDVKAK